MLLNRHLCRFKPFVSLCDIWTSAYFFILFNWLKFVSKSSLGDLSDIGFELKINEQSRQVGNTKDLLFSFDKIISYVSKFVTLKVGDLIYTGTPEGVGAVNIGDKLQGYIKDELFLEFEVK